jgi:hypothetical protein
MIYTVYRRESGRMMVIVWMWGSSSHPSYRGSSREGGEVEKTNFNKM